MQVERTYQAIVLGQPQRQQGRVETNVGRDLHDRKKMAAFAYMSNRHAPAELMRCWESSEAGIFHALLSFCLGGLQKVALEHELT